MYDMYSWDQTAPEHIAEPAQPSNGTQALNSTQAANATQAANGTKTANGRHAAPADAGHPAPHHDHYQAVHAVQVSLDRRDNGGAPACPPAAPAAWR
jgi:hypothetical protein